jgi:NADH-quinone oxidoreductase subunit J
MDGLMFCLAAAGLVVMSICVVSARSPLRAALALIVALCLQAVLYVLLDAPFVAAMQVLVYAGAIMVLFLFVIMLHNLGPDATRGPAYLAMSKVLGGVAMVYLLWHIFWPAYYSDGVGKVVDGSVKHIGYLLLTDFLFSFEAISVLLLVSVVGAIVFGMKRLA